VTDWPGLIERDRERLDIGSEVRAVTLLEGNTPLVHATGLTEVVGRDVFLKVEGSNPTGSFKDRGMTLAVSKAFAAGARAVVCASTGNTSASAAAYAARAGMEAIVVLPAGNVALGKLAQAVRHGAAVVAIDGNFDDALRLVREMASDEVVLVNSLNPDRIEGQQTVAWEVLEAMGSAPATHCLPVGNAGNITAHWKGYRAAGASPRLWGFQASGAAPLVHGEAVDEPQTIATAIRIGHPASWDGAIMARDESEGRIEAVTDEQIMAAYDLLASGEGIFCEPASAASVAGLLAFRGDLPEGAVVCTLTGHGLKDPGTAVDTNLDVEPVAPTLTAVRDALGW
jgi:threonine synthase